MREKTTKNIVVRVAPNISPNAGHYGHALLFLVSCWIAKALKGRAIVRIDWHFKIKGSMHRNATIQEKKEREAGFNKIYKLAKLCGISEVIDEYGIRHSLDGIERRQKYRVFKDEENIVPIIYEYDWGTLDVEKLDEFLTKLPPELARPSLYKVEKSLPLFMEYTHIYLSTFPKKYIKKLKELCIKTNQLPRRFHKAYCHMQMDRLLGVTYVVRGNDQYSDRIYNIHEKNINKEWNIPLLPVIKTPLIYYDGQKISASKEDGITGLFPTNWRDIKNMIQTVIRPKYSKYFLPEFDPEWFRTLLKSSNPILDAPIWAYKEIKEKGLYLKWEGPKICGNARGQGLGGESGERQRKHLLY